MPEWDGNKLQLIEQVVRNLVRNVRIRVLWLLIPLLATAQEPVAVFGTTVVIPSGLHGDIYYLPQNTQTLADLAAFGIRRAVSIRRHSMYPRRTS
jgi:hypothetical protein